MFLPLFFGFLALTLGSDGLQISNLRVPPAVRNGSEGAFLDCEYNLSDEELPNSGLVVKWIRICRKHNMFLPLFFGFLALTLGSDGLQISNLRVPPAVRNGSEGAFLDCEYNLSDEELPNSGLVVKWFFNNEPTLVYQWIPGIKPQVLGVLRGRLNLEYHVSEHRLMMHRALYIVNPTVELSGDYKCSVSTFLEEDFQTKKMTIYAPGDNFRIDGVVMDQEYVNISCSSENVYPKPELFLYQLGPQDNTTQDFNGVSGIPTNQSGVFNIQTTQLVRRTDLLTPTAFECELRIPEINYKVTKVLEYYPG